MAPTTRSMTEKRPEKRKKMYSSDDLREAVDLYRKGAKLAKVCQEYPHVPRRTITSIAKKQKENVTPQKPGKKPTLAAEVEEDLEAWIIAMQADGNPVSRDLIMVKGNELFEQMFETARAGVRMTRSQTERQGRILL